MAILANRAWMTVTGSPGTGTVTLNAARANYLSFASAGIVDGSSVCYEITEPGVGWEIGIGTYTHSGTTMSRDVVEITSAGNQTKLSFTSSATVFLTASARVLEKDISPLEFGAIGDGSTDDTAALQAAFTFWTSQDLRKTFNLMGRRYKVTAPITAASGANYYARRMTNGTIIAGTGFSGTGYLVDWSAIAANKLARIFMDNLDFNANSIAGGCLKMNKTQGVWVSNCIFQKPLDCALLKQENAAASELHINNCRFEGDGTNMPIGLDLSGNDNQVVNCLISEFDWGCIFRNGGNTFTGNHVYNFSIAATSVNGVWCKSDGMQIDNNYIDGVVLRLDLPRYSSVQNNKFLNTLSQSGGYSFILLTPQSASSGLYNLQIRGNAFRSTSGTVESIKTDTANGTWNSADVFGVHIRDNTFASTTLRTSHPVINFAISSATSGTHDLSSLLPPNTGVITGVLNAVFVRSGGTGVSWYFTRSSNVITGVVNASSSGRFTGQGTVNVTLE